jgi:hypothetical protein
VLPSEARIGASSFGKTLPKWRSGGCPFSPNFMYPPLAA